LVGFSQVFGIRADQLLWPLELVEDKAAQRLLEQWREARVKESEAFDQLAEHLQAHPRADEVLQDLMTAEDWQALLARVEAGWKTMSRDLAAKHDRKATFADVKSERDQKEQRRGKR
jgi:hypothetical protein